MQTDVYVEGLLGFIDKFLWGVIPPKEYDAELIAKFMFHAPVTLPPEVYDRIALRLALALDCLRRQHSQWAN